MSKNTKKIRKDEMWCPECGAPIKKGFFTCANCKLKVRFTKDINKKQGKDKKPGSAGSKGGNGQNSGPSGPEQTGNGKEMPETISIDKETNGLLDDIFEGDDPHQENKMQGGRPGWWNYS